MTDATANPAAPTINWADALKAIKTLIDSQPEPGRTYLNNALRDLELAAEQDADLAIMSVANKVPFVGSAIGKSFVAALNAALDAGVVAITNA
jgi:hypothetical protein